MLFLSSMSQDSGNTQQVVSQISQDVLISSLLASIKPLMSIILKDLVNDPNLKRIVINSVVSVLNDKEFRTSLKLLLIELLKDENIRRELRDLVRDVGNPLRILLSP